MLFRSMRPFKALGQGNGDKSVVIIKVARAIEEIYTHHQSNRKGRFGSGPGPPHQRHHGTGMQSHIKEECLK